MKTFKTTINCGSCIRAISPTLNEVVGENNWTVDTENPDKILTIHNENVDETELVNAVRQAGFEIDALN